MINISRKAADQAETLRAMNSPDPAVTLDPGENRVTRVYSITSGKGGVGKTAVVANIAVSLARLGKNVLILDADLGLLVWPALPHLVAPAPTGHRGQSRDQRRPG